MLRYVARIRAAGESRPVGEVRGIGAGRPTSPHPAASWTARTQRSPHVYATLRLVTAMGTNFPAKNAEIGVAAGKLRSPAPSHSSGKNETASRWPFQTEVVSHFRRCIPCAVVAGRRRTRGPHVRGTTPCQRTRLRLRNASLLFETFVTVGTSFEGHMPTTSKTAFTSYGQGRDG